MNAVESLQLMTSNIPAPVAPVPDSGLHKELMLCKDENDRLREDLRREKASNDVNPFGLSYWQEKQRSLQIELNRLTEENQHMKADIESYSASQKESSSLVQSLRVDVLFNFQIGTSK